MKKTMSKWRKNRKKVLAGILAIAMVAGYFPQTKNQVEAAETDINFDESNVVLKLGVMSDIHLASAADKVDTIKTKVNYYAKSVATLNAMSGNDLDVLMLAGDYTGYGMYEQGKTFATASSAIMEAINTDKEEGDKTQFFFTYGNHDTEWKGQMTYEEWEALFAEEGLMNGLSYGPENSGCYKYTRKVNNKTYYFFSVETETYNAPCNTYRVDVLEWLEQELAATPKDAYVYVVSHAPIKESGVYGADLEYCKNADWATAEEGYTGTIKRSQSDGTEWEVSSNINAVLKKYPQVIYLSGHTHYTNSLESSIMSDMYTAITVSQYTTGSLYDDASNYLDSGEGNTKPGYSLYIEVDANGNQRITRVNTLDSSLVSSVVVNGTEYSEVAVDPTDESKKVSAYYTDSVTITYDDAGEASTLTPWIMKAPSADGSHLVTYSADARRETPVFNEGNLELTKVENATGENLVIDFTFPTAKCENYAVIRYEFTIYDEDGTALDTRWILGNWTTNTDGVTEDGKTHLDATKLSYTNTYAKEQLVGVTKIYATLTAVNEFGGRATLTCGSENATFDVGVMKPTASVANKNMFDGFTEDRIMFAANTGDYKSNVLTFTRDTSDELSIAVDTGAEGAKQKRDEIILVLNEEQYQHDYVQMNTSYNKTWNLLSYYEDKLTDIDVNDTFVFDTEFRKTTNNEVYITFRAPNAYNNMSCPDYSGLLINSSGVELWLDREKIASSTAFKLEDTETHQLQIVSEPENVSVWIDDILVFYREMYTFAAKGITPYTGTGTTEDPYKHSFLYNGTTALSTTLTNLDMIPAIALYIANNSIGTQFEFINPMLYLYDTDKQVEGEFGAVDRNYYDVNKASGLTGMNHGNNWVEATNTTISQDISTDFSPTDTMVIEFDYTPIAMDAKDADGDGTADNNAISGINIIFRTDANGKDIPIILRNLQAGTSQTIYPVAVNAGVYGQAGDTFILNEKIHVKIVADHEKASIYLNGVAVSSTNRSTIENLKYAEMPSASSFNTESTNPAFKLYVYKSTCKIENISIRKAGGKLENITELSDNNNLLLGEKAEIIPSLSAKPGNEVVNGTNFYTDLRYFTLSENSYSNKYIGESFYLFGAGNTNLELKHGESFVMSTLVRASNGSLTEGDKKYSSRITANIANYNGKKMWCFIQDTTLYVYATTDRDEQQKTVDLAAEMKYSVGDYVRFTIDVSPYGFDIYLDGIKVYSQEVGDGTNVTNSNTAFGANGAEVRFLDVSVHYNYDNEALYAEKILQEAGTYENGLHGVYYAKKAEYDTKVEAIKNVCATATDNKELQGHVAVISQYVNEILASGKIVNNMVLSEQTAIGTEETVNAPKADNTNGWNHKNLYIYESVSQAPDMQAGDVWIFEADVKATDTCSRIGFGIRDTYNEGLVMVQADKVYYYGVGSSGNATWISQTRDSSFAAGNWHVKYVVEWNNKIVTELTSEAGAVITYEVLWNQFDATRIPGDARNFYPSIYFVNTVAELSNIYVGYDLKNDIAKLDTAVTIAKEEDLSAYTLASKKVYNDVVNQVETINTDIANYVGDATGTVYTTPYSRTEMENAVTTLANARQELVTAEAQVLVGEENVGVVSVGIATGEELPLGYVEDKYIISWTLNGNDATEFDNSNGANAYVAKYIDLNMLDVKKQTKANATDNAKRDTRFIASVNSLEYVRAGFVFSIPNKNPEIGGANCRNASVTTVYTKLWADDELTSVSDIYTNGYSTHMYAWEITGIPQGATIYARAYVELSDGTIVYGSTNPIVIE